jgi:hypothetical protein
MLAKSYTPKEVSGSNPVQFAFKRNAFKRKEYKGSRVMPRIDLGCFPKENPCAQCGKPIAAPEWIESGPNRVSYLWHCWACDYQFEAVAFFEYSEAESEPLAA